MSPGCSPRDRLRNLALEASSMGDEWCVPPGLIAAIFPLPSIPDPSSKHTAQEVASLVKEFALRVAEQHPGSRATVGGCGVGEGAAVAVPSAVTVRHVEALLVACERMERDVKWRPGVGCAVVPSPGSGTPGQHLHNEEESVALSGRHIATVVCLEGWGERGNASDNGMDW